MSLWYNAVTPSVVTNINQGSPTSCFNFHSRKPKCAVSLNAVDRSWAYFSLLHWQVLIMHSSCYSKATPNSHCPKSTSIQPNNIGNCMTLQNILPNYLVKRPTNTIYCEQLRGAYIVYYTTKAY